MHFLYISTVLHFHMYVCYMLINESVSQSVMHECIPIITLSHHHHHLIICPIATALHGIGQIVRSLLSPFCVISICVCVCPHSHGRNI